MRKNNAVRQRFEDQMGLQTRAERIWFYITFALLILHTEAVVFLQDVGLGQFSPLRSLLCAAIILPVCFGGVLLCRRFRLVLPDRRPFSRKQTVRIFLLTLVLAYACCAVWMAAYWPGLFSVDSIEQLDQVVSGQYSNWHPVLQTWLFLGLPYWLFHSFNAIIPVQMLWFSLAVAYLMTVLYNRRCPILFMVLGGLYILANPNTMRIMLFPWKDSAMSIFALVLFTQLIQIYATDGAWLKNRLHLAAFTAIVFLTNAMRHNAVLLVAPCIVVLLVFLKSARKQILISAACVVAATLLLQGPVFSLANVEKPGNRVVETMGFPMTILCGVYMDDPEAMSPECREFMASLATPFDWAYYYEPGEFNSIKWYSSKDAAGEADAAGYATLFRYTAEAIRNSPASAFTAAGKLTAMVWSIGGGNGWRIAHSVDPNPYGLTLAEGRPLSGLVSAYETACDSFPLRLLFNYVGGAMLVMLFAAVSCVGGGLKRAFLILSILAHNFGTMLLLSGSDFRFFHCNFLVIVPLLFIFLFQKGLNDHEVRQQTI